MYEFQVCNIIFNYRREAVSTQGTTRFEIRQVGQFDDHNSMVWKVIVVLIIIKVVVNASYVDIFCRFGELVGT